MAAVGGPAVAVVTPTTKPTTSPVATATTAPATAPAVAAVDTTTVKRVTLRLSFDADGTFEPVDAYEVRFSFKRYSGDLTIRRVAAAGSMVAKGDVLMGIDTDPIDRQIAVAESAVAVAKAGVAKAEADIGLGDKADALAMDFAKETAADAATGLKRYDADDAPATLTLTKLGQTQMDDQLSDATDELDQLKQMYKSEDLTNKTADIVLKRAEQTQATYKVYDQVEKVMTERALTYEPAVRRHAIAAGVEQQQQSVDQLAAAQAQTRVLREAALTAARAGSDEADRALVELKKDRAAMTVTSPIDGVVVYGAFAHKAWVPGDPKRLVPDEKVTPDQVVITVYQPGKLKVSALCPEASLTQMPPGTRVSVRPAALPDVSYTGTCGPTVPFGGTTKDGQPAYDVPVSLPPKVDARLAPGFAAAVGVDVPPAVDAIVVPVTAVFQGKVIVHTADGKDEPRPVILGRRDAENVEVRSGLAVGDVVLTKAKP